MIYFDPDIRLYGSIAPILGRLADADIILTPHLTGWLDDGGHPGELAILQSGSYNLGFIALRRSAVAQKFVQWWQGKLSCPWLPVGSCKKRAQLTILGAKTC